MKNKCTKFRNYRPYTAKSLGTWKMFDNPTDNHTDIEVPLYYKLRFTKLKIMKMSLQQETMFRAVHNFTHAMRVESFMTCKTLTWFNHCNPNPAEKFSWDFNYELKISLWNQSLTILGQRHWWKDEPGWHDNISKRSCAGYKINSWAHIIMVIKHFKGHW